MQQSAREVITGGTDMKLWAAAAMAMLFALPAHAASKPPRSDIRLVNQTSYYVKGMFFNNNDTALQFEVMSLNLNANTQGNGYCNTNGGCKVRVCIFRLKADDGTTPNPFGAGGCSSSNTADLVYDKTNLVTGSCLGIASTGTPSPC